MSDRSVPTRVRDFLITRVGRLYCDDCIQARLGMKWRQQVQLVTATLGVTPSFERKTDHCSVCNELKQVICALPSAKS